MATKTYASLPYTEPANLVRDFASRGIVALPPEGLGIPEEIHHRIYSQEKQAYLARKPVTPGGIPDVLKVINAPGVVDACNRIVGRNWAIVPFTHNASFASGARDQHWHKDDNGPYNARKQRHHQAVQIEMLYYPQDVTEVMGPTATIPYSHYWTFNHEENHDNFAGADHLDFEYQISGLEGVPVSGPDSEYDWEDVVNRRTAHDVRMREAVTNTRWPLVAPFEAAPLRAGSVLFYSHNTFHRGNHRRDDWRLWDDHPRFMWRFWIYRTTEPDGVAGSEPEEIAWRDLGVDPLTGVDLREADDDTIVVWRYHSHWMRTGRTPPPRPETSALSSTERDADARDLHEQLHAAGDEAEPRRIGAAYKFASLGDDALAVKHLGAALYSHRESVRRAATYGLVAVGEQATDTFLEATASPVKWVRKAGVYGLGDCAPLTGEVLESAASLLHHDPSVYVRAVAAGTLGCLGRRAAGTGNGVALIPDCLEALILSLEREENRLSMDLAQKRSIKFARPTDECDVCEGNGVDMGLDRFEPVRSAVRENALWSMVILCSHGAHLAGNALDATINVLITVVRCDKNVICVGLAMDALGRLANLETREPAPASLERLRAGLLEVLGDSPIRCWESLVRGGLSTEHLSTCSEAG
ncbi:MAG: phytanoyl-CoA dioxygenase family protein [Gemmatimonadetes bacterium]|nr:phytanoyl-CoA dioxygenase family protein [Gemmatimonadota bacterium]